MDFRANADGENQWILQVKDHFSRYTWLLPIPNKKASTVAEEMKIWIGQNGRPRRL
jgi:hypothetical protein